MKTYFGYNLTGKELLPTWMAFYVAFILPYAGLMYYTSQIAKKEIVLRPTPLPLVGFALLLLAVSISFFLIKKTMGGIKYGEKQFAFTGTFGRFLWVCVAGAILVPFTFLIYYPFYVRKVVRFFVNNTQCDGEYLEFRGDVATIGVIMLITLLPLFILILIFMDYIVIIPTLGFIYRYLINMAQVLLVVPILYFVYRWLADVNYKEYVVNWDTEPMPAIGKLFLEMFLTLATFYIYWPMARVRLYKYFVDCTVANNGMVERRFGFDADEKGDFIFIWKQALLSVVSVGIYVPWAICRVNKRILERTFVEYAPLTEDGIITT